MTEAEQIFEKHIGLNTELGYLPYKKEDIIDAINEALVISRVSNRFSPEQMAEWFHNNYEEIAIEEGWQTQDKCRVEFKDLPESNRATMIKVCERWLNGC
jgi:hypothetical protein